MERRRGLQCLLMYVLNKSLASGHPVAGWLPAAPNTDDWRALSEPPPFSHGPGSPETTQPAEKGCRCIPSMLLCSYCSRKILPGEALCRMGLLPRKGGGLGSGPEGSFIHVDQRVADLFYKGSRRIS